MVQPNGIKVVDPAPIAEDSGQAPPVGTPPPPPLGPEARRVSQADDAGDELRPFYIPKDAFDSTSKSNEEPSKIPAMIPGFRANPFTFPISGRVDEAIKKLRYVDYSLLSRSARENAARHHQNDEVEISQIDWFAAAESVEIKTLEYHGEARANALKAHHRNVRQLAITFDWRIACVYDRRTRGIMAHDTRHDPTSIDQVLVLQASIDLAPMRPDIWSSAAPLSAYPSPSSLVPIHSPSPSRRYSPFDQSGRQSRSSKPQWRCFRCGTTGHLSASCDSKSTSAGLACAPWIRNPGAKSAWYLFDEAAGQPFCFNWSRDSHCRFADRCRNSHRCSVCGETRHGANACPK